MNQATEKLFHYTQCGLDNVYLATGVNLYEPDGEYGGGYSIKNAEELHRMLVLFVAHKAEELSAKEVRFLRIEMDLSQKELAGKLGLTDQMISLWERGEKTITRAASLVMRSLAVSIVWHQALDIETVIDDLATLDFDQADWDHLVMNWNPAQPTGNDDGEDMNHWVAPLKTASG
jgi:DNA-binding transcriptional regulator YiaG